MPAANQPKEKWIECDHGDFQEAIRKIQAAGIVLTYSSQHNQDIYYNKDEVVGRRYVHRKSMQCLITQRLREYIPTRINHAEKERSIYPDA